MSGSGCTYGMGYYLVTGTNGSGSSTYTQQLPNNSGTFEVASFANAGDMGYYNGSTFSVLTGNTASGKQALTESSSGTPSWTGLSAAATAGTVFWAFCNGIVGSANSMSYFLGGFQTSSNACTQTSDVPAPMPYTCTAGNLYVNAGTGGASSNSYVTIFTGSPPVAATVKCALWQSGMSATTCNDTTHSHTFMAGDLWSIGLQTGSAGDSMNTIRASFTCQ